MTTRSPSLPASLTVPRDLRASLSRRIRDERTRIVYDVTDTAQPVPHRGVILIGGRLVGWVFAAGWEDEQQEESGAVWAETIETLCPTPGDDNPLHAVPREPVRQPHRLFLCRGSSSDGTGYRPT